VPYEFHFANQLFRWPFIVYEALLAVGATSVSIVDRCYIVAQNVSIWLLLL
jgi:hypothetical protein